MPSAAIVSSDRKNIIVMHIIKYESLPFFMAYFLRHNEPNMLPMVDIP